MPKPKQEEQKPAVAEPTPFQKYYRDIAAKGYANLGFFGWLSEDLKNPNEEIITLGFEDPNGLKIPPVSMPKEKWITTARLILAKYDTK